MKPVAANIDRLLEERNWTYRKFARNMNLSYRPAHDLISGYKEYLVTDSMYQRVADVFEISLDKLFKETVREHGEDA